MDRSSDLQQRDESQTLPYADGATMAPHSAATSINSAVAGSSLLSGPASAIAGRRILLVEDDDQLFAALRESLLDAGCEVIGIHAPVAERTMSLPYSRIDAVLLDTNLRDSAVFAERLRSRGIPILMVTGNDSRDLPASLRGLERLRKPFTETELLRSMATVLGTESTACRSTILIVEDEALVAIGLKEKLEDRAARIEVAETLRDGFRRFRQLQRDLRAVLVDMNLPDGSGAELARRMRAVTGELPIVLLTDSARRGAAEIFKGDARLTSTVKSCDYSDLMKALDRLGVHADLLQSSA